MPWVERKKVLKSLCCAESGHLSPAGLSALSAATWYFCFCFLNNNMFLKLGIWITHFYYGNGLFCFERKGKTQSVPRLPDEKVNQPVKTHGGSGKKTTWSTCSGTVVSPASFSHVKLWIWTKASSRKYFQQGRRKIKQLRLLASSNF